MMQVTFPSGQELNERTRSFRYKVWSTYALIWSENDEVAIAEMKSFIIMRSGDGFTLEYFRHAFSLGLELDGSQVNSPRPRRWHFQAKRYFDWIDPRAEESD